MNYLIAVFLGIIEGITEFLPISSTGHLILASQFLRLPTDDFLKTFEIAIQLGAILSVAALYGKRFLQNREIWKKITVAFIPTVVLGVIFYKAMKQMMGAPSVVIWSLFLGGIAMLIFEKKYRPAEDEIFSIESLPYKKAAILGACQALAMIPGVSRSGATILGGLALGLKRETIVEFSFLLAAPTMLGATAYDLYKTGINFSANQLGFLSIGFIISFLIAWLSIKCLIKYVQKHDFKIFAIYRIILAVVLFAIFRK
ncbi:MAG TPA: undecaprenyl-diphosphate phosphatase [Candidatus Pacearchaeota archaeon]|nr:undecaprenyl-diphosphate phosphatase [Candidatus Pacearchaeota archaeon]